MKMFEQLANAWIDAGGEMAWAISPGCWREIEKHLTPGCYTFECGSGLSTWLFAHSEGVYHTAVEHDRLYFDRVCTEIPRLGKERNPLLSCELYLRPLTGTPPWYAFLPAGPFDIVLIDGPPGGGRTGILPHLDSLIDRDTIVIIDDTQRPANRRLIETITREYPQHFDESRFLDNRRHFSILTPV